LNEQLTRRGRAWVVGDLVQIDAICATKYLTHGPEVWAEHTFEELIPDFAKRVHPGDLLVAGTGFGFGMGHDHPILGLARCGIAGIIAPSFGFQFYRAAVAHCMPLLETIESLAVIEEGVEIEADFRAGSVEVVATGQIIRGRPLEGPVLEIIEAGGLVRFLRNELGFTGGAVS
jgi:3-isopropylmalate/(R)-2-methylmalate dehydratase small subunit